MGLSILLGSNGGRTISIGYGTQVPAKSSLQGFKQQVENTLSACGRFPSNITVQGNVKRHLDLNLIYI